MEEENTDDKTTISVFRKSAEAIERLKIHPRQSAAEVLDKILNDMGAYDYDKSADENAAALNKPGSPDSLCKKKGEE